MPHHIKDLLAHYFAQSNDWRIILLRDWDSIVGDLSSRVRLEKIEKDTLILCVQDACWMHELYMLSPLLLKTINKKLDQPYIKRLRFKQVGLNKKKVPLSVPQTDVHAVSVVVSAQEHQALACIHDPQLHTVLTHYLRRCKRER